MVEERDSEPLQEIPGWVNPEKIKDLSDWLRDGLPKLKQPEFEKLREFFRRSVIKQHNLRDLSDCVEAVLWV